MPLPVIDDVYRVALNWIDENSGFNATNVIHIANTGGDAEDVWDALDGNVTTNMWEQANVKAGVNQVVITKLDGAASSVVKNTGRPSKWEGPASDAGSLPQVCGLVKLNTGQRGRSFRGRVYLPFCSENQVDNGKIVSGGMTEWQDAWEAFILGLVGDGCQLVVASYLLESALDVQTVLCERDTATQRRRMKRQSA